MAADGKHLWGLAEPFLKGGKQVRRFGHIDL